MNSAIAGFTKMPEWESHEPISRAADFIARLEPADRLVELSGGLVAGRRG
jgi:hypothetical protein